mmetsp:Transcript_12803/g.40999  ORF Transcript_12803/g.40999 Transcript_12803/m.40999 type:complete len:207 (+) Transcript_12803:312-932(+)
MPPPPPPPRPSSRKTEAPTVGEGADRADRVVVVGWWRRRRRGRRLLPERAPRPTERAERGAGRRAQGPRPVTAPVRGGHPSIHVRHRQHRRGGCRPGGGWPVGAEAAAAPSAAAAAAAAHTRRPGRVPGVWRRPEPRGAACHAPRRRARGEPGGAAHRGLGLERGRVGHAQGAIGLRHHPAPADPRGGAHPRVPRVLRLRVQRARS